MTARTSRHVEGRRVAGGAAKFPGTFPGTIKAPLDVSSLTGSADVVCKGKVVDLFEEGRVQYLVGDAPMTFRRMVAFFHVDRVHKGTLSRPDIEIEFLDADVPSSLERLGRLEYALVFLRRKKARCQFAHITTSKMPIGLEPISALKERASPLSNIRNALIRSLDDANEDVVLAAIEQLGKLKGTQSRVALQPLAVARDPIRRGAAIAALLNGGDVTQVDPAVRVADALPEHPLREHIKGSIYSAVAALRDPAATGALLRAVRRKDRRLRYAAVRALRNIRSERTVPLLMKTLDDTDEDVRYQALMALADVTGRPEWGTAIDAFRRDEATYIGRWKAWWTREHKR